jgi:DNA end-binding protein Ku
MRTAYKGTLQFGLLAIPLRLGVAADKAGSLFHQMHQCGARIGQSRYCKGCGEKDIPWENVGTGVELADGTMVPVTDAELEALKAWTPKVITLQHFCQASEIDPLLLDDAYYVEPVDGGGPAHALLNAAMTATEGLAAVCTIAYPQKVALALLQPRGAMFVLTQMRWPDQIRPADVKLPPATMARPQEVQMATRLVKSMTKPWKPEDHTDTYRDALVDLVAAKASGAAPSAAEVKAPETKYTDMMELLQASIAAAKPARRKKTQTAVAS